MKIKKIFSITNLATIAVLTAVGNETLNVSNLVKTDYNTKIIEIKNKTTYDQVNIRRFYCKTQTSKFSKQK